MERSKNSEFGLLAIDLDNFKQVNDTLGHQSGDKVLIEVAEILSRSIRGHDYAFRLGGDEFACVLTNINQDCNHIVANRIQTSISESAFLQRVNVSGSIGSTFAQTQDDQQSIYERADRALYSAKAAGRNCIVAA
jgi:diguanylate cyclase (GGDEF)-like protein